MSRWYVWVYDSVVVRRDEVVGLKNEIFASVSRIAANQLNHAIH